MKAILNLLSEIQGRYEGDGMNHEGQKFSGQFVISPVLENHGAYLTFSATGANGENFHSEHTLIGNDFEGNLNIFVLSNNHPGMTPHVFKNLVETASGSKKLIFGFGNPENNNSFREEIVLEIFPDKKVDYRYFWGMPNGPFEERSGATMSLKATQ